MTTYYSSFYPIESADGAKGSAAFLGAITTTIIYLYKRSATTLSDSDKPNGNVIYTFATADINSTAVTNGWYESVPSGSDPLYIVAATATGIDPTDTIASNEWTSPVIFSQSGLSTATIFLFQRSNSPTLPAVPSGSTTYTFSSGILSGNLYGWSQTAPDTALGKYLFATTATAISSSSTDTIANTEWASVVVLTVNGENGTDGSDGATGLTAYLTNESHIVPASYAGAVSSYSGATGQFKVFQQNVGDVSSNFTLSTVSNPQSLTISYTGTTYTVTAGLDSGEDLATVTIRATGSGAYSGVSIDKVFTLAKSKGGQDGSSPKLLSITADRQVINYSGTGALNPATQTTAFTAYKQNTTNAVSWTIKDTLGNTLTPVTTYLFSGTGDTNSMTAAQFSAAISVNGARGVVVTATLTDGTTFTDSITVVKVVDGTNGTNGTNGTSPLVYDIITSSPVIVKDAPDAATTGTYSSITIQGRKYDGNTTSNYGWITVTANGDTEATTATDTATTPVTLSPASNSGKSSYTVKLYNQATVSGATLLDSQSITVVFKGASGTNGTNARAVSLSTNTQAFAYDSTGATPSPSTSTITATALNTSGTVYYEFVLDGTSVQNTATNTYTYTPQASFSNMPDTVRVNIREGTSTSTILASDMIAMTGLKNTVNGTDGLAALTPVISNSAHTLPTTNTGTVTYTGSGTTIRLYEGTTELTYDGVGTSNGTWKIVATPTNITTGTLTDSGTFVTVGDHSAMTANTASISYAITGKRAGGGSISLTLFQTFSKSIQGDNGSNGANGLAVVLSNESHVFPANNAGAVSSYTGSGTLIRLYEGATELVYDGTGTANGTWTVSSVATNITRGSLTDSGNYVTVGDHSGVADGTDTSSIVYTITGKTSTGAAINLTKTQSFSKAKTGGNGSPGAAAISGYLTSESSVVFTYADGTPTNFNGVNGFLKIIQGTTDVTATATSFSATASGCTGTINTADNTPVNGQIKGYYQVTAMSADSGTLTLSATFGGTTITKTFTVTKSKAGYEIVSVLPTANLFQGRVVFLTTDNKLYRYNGTTWVKEVAAADISGTLADAQIAAVAASKVTGQLTNAQIASIDAATKLTGVVPIANIPTIPTTNLSGTISTTQIADDAITTAKIAANAITAAEIAADTITSGQIAANAITASELAANSVTAGKIAAGSITATEIAANTITAAKLVAGTITANEIAANTITAAKIAAGTITAAEIAAGTITAAKIAADTITANQIAANAITASEIATDAITADKISAGSITAAKLAATNVITLSAQIQDAIITTAKIGDLQVNSAKIANLTVGTQKIEDLAISRSSSSYYNFNGYSYPTDGVWYDLFVTQGGYVYVGSGNGSYNYTQTGTGTYQEPIYGYTYVGPGLGDYNYVTSQFGLYTSVTTGSAAQSGTQVVNIEAVVVIARDGGSDDNVRARVIRTNDNQELPESYSTLRARSGPSTYALMFRDPFPIAGVANNYKVQLMNLSDNSHIYEASMRATLFRK